jgi:septal ring factor EnvC (AmiA/AmiB activator)
MRRSKLKKATVITICFIFFLCSTFTFCYATSSQAPGNSLKGTQIADSKKEREEKIEKLEEKIKQLKEDKAKIEKEIKEKEEDLKHLKKKKS